jgi:hypothetical protein
MAVIYSKWPKNIAIFSIPRPSKIYTNWYLGLENMPPGDPAAYVEQQTENRGLEPGRMQPWRRGALDIAAASRTEGLGSNPDRL